MLRRVLTRSSLSFEIALAAALLVALVVGLLTAFNLRAQLELSRRLLEGQARGQAANVAAAAAPLVVTSQYSELDALLRRMASLPEVQRLRVLDPSGRLLSDVATVAGRPQRRFDTAVLTPPAAAAEGGTLVEYNDTTLVVWEPITAGTAIGWLRLDYSLAHLSAVRAELLRQALATALIAMVAAFVLFAAFLRRPARALEDAAAFAERLDTRRGERLSIEFQAREIERLGVALNRVSQRLAEQDRALRAVGERLRAILEHAIDGIVILDEGGRIQGLNPAAERLFGYTEAEIRGAPFARLVPDCHLDRDSPVRAHTALRFEAQAQRRDGTNLPVIVGLSGVPLEDERLFVAIVRDHSEKKKLERMKSRFVAAVSHELRTPLASLQGALELLASGSIAPLKGRAREFVTMAYQNARRLALLVSEILDFERMELRELVIELRPVALVPLLEGLIETHRESARRRGVEITLKSPSPGIAVLTDPVRLEQVLDILLASAVRHCAAGEQVELRVSQHEKKVMIRLQGCGPWLAGADSPLGAPLDETALADEAAQDVFYQEGLELGLGLARAILERLGGNVFFERVAAGGVRCTIILPQETDAPAHTPAAPASPAGRVR